jgi:outer membrane protein
VAINETLASKFAVAGCAIALLIGSLRAQPSQASTPLTLHQAVENSLKNYPSIRVSDEQIKRAAAAIQLARTAYLPRVDALAQINRATRNNVFGMLLPQTVIPSMSGPAIGSNNFGTVWGSAVGGLVTWEPFDFGLRSANVGVAAAARAQSEATEKRTRFDVAAATADAFLTLVAAQETVRAANAGVERAGVAVRIITAQVNAELRPGADQSRAEAEFAAAKTQLIQAQQAVDIARANLAEFVGLRPSEIAVTAGDLTELPPGQEQQSLNAASNPLVIEQNAVIAQARAELRALERTYFPRFSLQAAAYARGTGAELNGNRLGGLNGLAPNFQDYAVGFTMTFPILDLPSIHAREAEQNATIRAESARNEQIVVELRAQWNRAAAALDGARRVADNTPIQVSAARTTVQQATARYQSGLGNIDELAEAQRLLTQAEIDQVLATLGVWRGLLGIATAAGDIQPFIVEASR